MIESIAQLGVILEIDCPARISVGPRDGMAVGKKNVGGFLPVVGAGSDVENFEVGRTEKNCINAKGANGRAVAIFAEVVETDVVRGVGDAKGVEQVRITGMAIVVPALGLS